MKNSSVIIAIVGPTASGKSKLAIELAKKINAEIISCDSRQIYKEFDIATAKPSDYEKQEVKHYLFDIISPLEVYSASDYKIAAENALTTIYNKGKKAIVTGGTGFYFRTFLEGLVLTEVKPDLKLRQELTGLAETKGKNAVFEILQKIDLESSKKIHPNNLDKVIRAIEISKALNTPMSNTGVNFDSPYNVLWVGLDFKNRENLYKQINLRVDEMLANGLENEAQKLFTQYGKIPTLMNTIGYQEFEDYFFNNNDFETVVEKIKQNTRRYAKRQLTWFRQNKKIHWFYRDETNFEAIIQEVLTLYELTSKV